MRFDEYLRQNNVSQHKAAKQLRVAQSSVNRWVLNLRMPSAAHMLRISRWSGGQVTPTDFVLAMTAGTPEARAADEAA